MTYEQKQSIENGKISHAVYGGRHYIVFRLLGVVGDGEGMAEHTAMINAYNDCLNKIKEG